jgi:hypothetical protein
MTPYAYFNNGITRVYFRPEMPGWDKQRDWIQWRDFCNDHGYASYSSEGSAYIHWQQTHSPFSDRSGLTFDGAPRKVWRGTLFDFLEGRFVEPIHQVNPSDFSPYNGIFGDGWGSYSPMRDEIARAL